MDLNRVTALVPLHQRSDIAKWSAGSAWLAGGSWLFSEPQPELTTLFDLAGFGWPPIVVDDRCIEIAATCTFAQLAAFAWPTDHVAMTLAEACCRSLLGSFKVWNVATVGGNICLALPAAPMIAFAVALDAEGVVWMPEGGERRIRILELVVGPGRTSLRPGELLRSIELPAHALRRRTVLRRIALCTGGRSAALLVGTRDGDAFSLVVTAATPQPRRLDFDVVPRSGDLDAAIEEMLPPDAYYDDVHGRPAWRRRMTLRLAEEIRAELSEP